MFKFEYRETHVQPPAMNGTGSILASLGFIPREFVSFYDKGDHFMVERWGLDGDTVSLERWIGDEPIRFEFATHHIGMTSPLFKYNFPEKYLVKCQSDGVSDDERDTTSSAVDESQESSAVDESQGSSD